MAGPPEPPVDAREVKIVNFRALSNWIKFGVQAVRRNKWLAIVVTVSVVALTVLALAVLPKKYQVECKLLAQKNQVLAVAGDAQAGEGPTQAAADVIMRRENLVNLVRETKLVDEWPRRRAPIQRLRDMVSGWFISQPTEDEQVDALVGYLQQQLKAWTEQGTVTIQLNWPDPQMAYRLVDAAQRNFLESRHVQEITTIAESASIIEGHATVLRHDIDSALQEIQDLRARRRGAATAAGSSAGAVAGPAPVGAAAPRAPTSDPTADQHLTELRVLIDAKQKALDQLDASRQQRVTQLQAKLEEQRAVYTDEHPAVTDTKQALEVAGHDSPQTQQLRSELKRLQADYGAVRAGSAAPDLGKSGDSKEKTARSLGPFAASGRLPNDAFRVEQEMSDDRDPEVELARSKLRFAVENYQKLQDQLQKARIDLDTAEAAFKYRYTVVTPPEVPHGPISPKSGLILVASVVGGILLGILIAFFRDVRRGTLYERWQVEAALALPVLTDIRLPPHTRDKDT